MKKTIIAVLAVFISWAILDFVIHNVLLADAYAATSDLWRPMEEMKFGLMYFVSLVTATCFVIVFDKFFNEKS